MKNPRCPGRFPEFHTPSGDFATETGRFIWMISRSFPWWLSKANYCSTYYQRVYACISHISVYIYILYIYVLLCNHIYIHCIYSLIIMHIKVPEKILMVFFRSFFSTAYSAGWSNRSLGDFAKASNCNSFWSCTDNKDKIARVLQGGADPFLPLIPSGKHTKSYWKWP